MKKQTISIMLILALCISIQIQNTNTNVNKENIVVNKSSVQAFVSNSEKFLTEYNNIVAQKEMEELELENERIAIEEAKIQAEYSESLRIQNVGYQSWNLSNVSNITHEEMYQVLADTTMSHLAWAIVEAERVYEVNAFFIASIIALESGWATSQRAINSNNLTGMAVYGDDSPGMYFNSQDECVMETTKHLSDNYLTPGAIYYNGDSTAAVNIKYCESSDWHLKIDQIAYDLSHKYDTIFK